MSRRAVLVIALLGTSACTLGPDPERPTTAADEAQAFVNAEPSSPDSETSGGTWWRRFGDETTTRLVEQALVNNTDLRVAAARVLEAGAGLRQARGAQWPQVGLGGSAGRQKSSFVLPQVGRVGIWSTTYSADLQVSYQVDLFGKLARLKEAAWADALAQEAGQDALRHTIIAEVVRARVLIATTERALDITRRIRTSWESTLGTVERRYRMGVTPALDLRLARENLASARAAEVQLEGSHAQAKHALDVLVGRRPGTGGPLPDTLSELPDLEPVPPGLPAELLDRRPDLRQAELGLYAATSRIGAAMADLYPSLSLTGSAGIRSDSLSGLTSSDGLVYSAVANLLAPLFSGGQLRAGVDAAQARAEQAAATYAGAVLTALREVEDALVLNATNRRRVELTEERVTEARAADRLARDRYQRGVATLITVLDTERRLRLAEEALITARADLWNVRINLFLALGGDWVAEETGEAGHENRSAEVLDSPQNQLLTDSETREVS